MEERNKKSHGKTIIIILLCLIIIGGAIYIAYDKGIIFKDNKEKKTDTEIKQKEELVEKDLTDIAVKKEIVEKMKSLTGFSVEMNNGYSFVEGLNVILGKVNTLDNMLKNNLSENDKLSLALAATDTKKMTKSFEEMNFTKKEEYKNSRYNDISLYSEIALNDLDTTYSYLFGDEKIKYNDIEIFGVYAYFYDSVNKVYYRFNAPTGGTGPYSYLMYMNNFKSYGNKIYVNTNFGYISSIDGKICTSFDTILEDNNCSNQLSVPVNEVSTYKIDESNYEKFKNYKFVFEKDKNNNYVFKGLE